MKIDSNTFHGYSPLVFGTYGNPDLTQFRHARTIRTIIYACKIKENLRIHRITRVENGGSVRHILLWLRCTMYVK